MKSRDKTQKKKHESTIGKIIYGFLLFMPLLAIAVTCAYAIFNKNAYQSYDSELVESVNQIDSISFANNTLYTYQYKQPQTFNGDRKAFSYISITKEELNLNAQQYDSLTYIYLYSNNRVYFSDADNSHRWDYDLTADAFKSFSMITEYQPGLTETFNVILVSYKEAKLNNVFYYSIDKVEQSPLFNWAKNSLIYTGMNNTAQALDINNTFIPMLLTYWLIISVFYFLYDIILIILHVFHRKIHELEESI